MDQQQPSRRGPVALIVVAGLLALGPLWGFLGTVLGMVRTFREMGQPGGAGPDAMASHISLSLWTTAVGAAMAPIGLVLLILGIVWIVRVNRRRDEALRTEPAAALQGQM